MNEIERAMKCAEEAVCMAARLIGDRDAANAQREKVLKDYEATADCLRAVAKERDTLREKVKSLTDLLADASDVLRRIRKCLELGGALGPVEFHSLQHSWLRRCHRREDGPASPAGSVRRRAGDGLHHRCVGNSNGHWSGSGGE